MNRKVAVMVLLLVVAVMCSSCAGKETVEPVTEIVVPAETERAEPTEVSTEAPAEPPTEAPTEPSFELFSEDITFTYSYVNNREVMTHVVFTPSTADEDTPLPVIVWLHSLTERDAKEEWFKTMNLPGVLNNWQMNGFNAYVICPQLFEYWNMLSFDNPIVAARVIDIVEQFAQTHNIDRDNIVIAGHSLGGTGVMYLAAEYPDYFSKGVVMSSLSLETYVLKKIQIPMLGCVENMQNQTHFMNAEFKELFGADSVRNYESGHAELPEVAFTEDKDGDNNSDLVVWMFGHLEQAAEYTG